MSAPAIPAAAIADAVAATRAFLRIDGGGEDATLARLAASAFAVAEAFTGRAFVVRTFEDVIDATGGWQMLAAEPVGAIAGVTGIAIGAAPVVLAAGAYAIDIDGDGRGWVRVTANGRVAVSYSAGLAANWETLPAPLAQGVVALIAHLFNDRDGTALPPAAVAALWRPFRRLTLAPAGHRP